MEELFKKIADDFSGKVFTKEDLMNKYSQINRTVISSYHKKDIENYIKVTKNKGKNQSL